MTTRKAIVVSGETYVPPMNTTAIARRESPDLAIVSWAKENNVGETLVKAVRGECGAILSDMAKLRQTFYDIGMHLVTIRKSIDNAELFGAFASKVSPTLGLSRTVVYSYIGRVETMRQKFPHHIVRSYVLDSTNGKGIIDSQNGFLTPDANKAFEKVGACPDTFKDEIAAVQWADKWLVALRGQKSKPTTAGLSASERARKAAMQSFNDGDNSYVKRMVKLSEKDTLVACHGFADDILTLVDYLLKCKPQADFLEKVLHDISTRVNRSGILKKVPAA